MTYAVARHVLTQTALTLLGIVAVVVAMWSIV